jgi:hypothetical protein
LLLKVVAPPLTHYTFSNSSLKGQVSNFFKSSRKNPTKSPTKKRPTKNKSKTAKPTAITPFCDDNKKKVYICHYDDVTGKYNTLCISMNAAPKHTKEHTNDVYGRCENATPKPSTATPTGTPTTAKPTFAPSSPCEEGYALINGNCTHTCDAGTHGCSNGTMCFRTLGASFKCLNPIVEDLLSGGVKEGVLDLFHK